MIYLPEFLAKNENPSALHPPIVIKAISSVAPDGNERFVCPVRALYYWRSFIQKQGNKDNPQLFQFPLGSKASPRDLSRDLVDVIRSSHSSLSDADARLLNVRAHDIRAVAASRFWSQRPVWSDLASYFKWKNRSVFIDVYSRGMSALQNIMSD